MKNKINIFVLCTLCVLLGSFFNFKALAQVHNNELLQNLSANEKIINPASLLAQFYLGKSRVSVIVSLEQSTAAQRFSEEAKSSAPDTFTQTPGNTFYNLEDENIKIALKETVAQTIDAFVADLDPQHIEVTRKFEYVFGFTALVTPEGIQTLVDSGLVVDIAENMVLEPNLAQGIPLMGASAPRSTYDGSRVSVAICDTGIDTYHPKLGGSTTIFNTKVIGGWDTGMNDSDPRPSGVSPSAHGTNCAGIAAGDLGTTGDYIGGVAPGAKLYSIKISNDTNNSASIGGMVAGWEWALTHKNDDTANPILVISTSFGGGKFSSTCDFYSTAMTQAAANAVAGGITIFASSGNDGYCDSMGWPACISHVISVGAVYDANFGTYQPCVSADSCANKIPTFGCSTGYYVSDPTAPDKVTAYSNSASFLTLFAPSNSAYSTDITGTGGYSAGDYYSSFGGTSAACPYAAGGAVVLQSAAKYLTGCYLTPADVKSKLTSTGHNITDDKVTITKPRIDLAAAVASIEPGPLWPMAYKEMVPYDNDLAILRQYRDEILKKNEQGKFYNSLLYHYSEKALQVLLNNPQLMDRARDLINANIDTVKDVLDGEQGVIYNTQSVSVFLKDYAAKSPHTLENVLLTVDSDLMKSYKKKIPFFGFTLE